MKNFDKYGDELKSGTVDICKFTKKHALKSDSCYGISCKQCYGKLFSWLDEEYKPQIDWSKVPVDTPVITENGNRHFFKYENDLLYTFDDGTTSWTYRKQ